MSSASVPTRYPLLVVTGAPGAGKSTTVQNLLDIKTEFVPFDSDWLLEPASKLVGRDIRFAISTWQPYRELWYAILHGIYKGGRVPVLFAPFDRSDGSPERLPSWCARVEMLLLDCSDDDRRERLGRRNDWSPERTAEAINDAASLRNQIPIRLNTSVKEPTKIARQVVQWLVDVS